MTADVRLASFALNLFPSTDVLCAYAAPVTQFFADTTGRWIQFGVLTVPTILRGRLWVIGFRTPGITANVGIFNPRLMNGTIVQIASDTDASVYSAQNEFLPGVTYQLAARVLGTANAANYMTIHTVSLAPP